MKTQTKVVVIGGGAIGLSTLYHLTKKGWSDVCLLERNDLTSGSTWHAAGLLPLFNLSYSVGKIHQYSVDFYGKLQEETGQDVGFSRVSNVRLAMTEDRMDEYRYYAGVAETLGVETKWMTPEEIKERWPYVETEGLIGAIQHPDDGYIQPADLCQGLRRGARAGGAEIYEHTKVTGLTQQPDDSWIVHTDKGDIACEHVVSCTGNFARQTGEMVGLDIPVMPVEHQYIVTEPHPEIVKFKENGGEELCVLREADSSWYLREEKGGLLLGPYEVGAPCCYVDGPTEGAKYELFEGDLDRLMPHIETCIERVPYFGEVGIKEVYNGAIAYTPDGSPIIGPAWNRKNLWLNEGHSFGITAAGGAGWQLAEWIVEGEPTIDMMGVDPRRFGSYAAEGFLQAKNEESYANVYTIHFPNEVRPAARFLRQSPCHDRMVERGAVMAPTYGWERPQWFAPSNDYDLPDEMKPELDVLLKDYHSEPDAQGHIKERYSFRRSNAFEYIGEECKNVMNNAGLLDMTAFSKFIVTGEGAADWLESILANRVPKTIGRIGLCHMLTKYGGVRAEFTVYKTGEKSFYLVSGGAFERHDYDELKKHLPKDGSVQLQNVTTQYGVLILAGPKSRDILSQLTRTDLSNESFKWLTGKQISVGAATAQALRVNFVGELGWELHHPIEMQNYIYDKLFEVGESMGLKPFGLRAMDSMRIEKSYRMIPRELSIEYSAFESVLDRFVRTDKEHIGSEGLKNWAAEGFKNKMITFTVDKEPDNDALGNEPIYHNGSLVGRVTSGAYGWRIGQSMGLGMVPPELSEPGTQLQVKILDTMVDVTVVEESPYDPDNLRLRDVAG